MPKHFRLAFVFCFSIAILAALYAPRASAALPKFLGGSGMGMGGQKGNLEYKYPSFWDNLMQQQSYTNLRQGIIEMSAYKYKDAAQSFAKAVVKNPNEPYPHLFLGMALYWQGQVDAALAEYKAALALAPDNDEAYQLLGIARAWKGDINAAFEAFLKAVELNPNRADAQMNLGSTYAALGNPEEALFHFRKAAQLDKRHPLYQYQLASLYERLGRDGLAEESFKKAISLYPGYEEAILALAVLYEKTGKNTPAEINYKRALKIKPGDSIARLRLANLLARQNRHAEAMDIIARAFLISPHSDEGLGLSIYYNGGGGAGSPGASAADSAAGQMKQLDNFKKRLARVPSTRQINIEVEMSLAPRPYFAEVETVNTAAVEGQKKSALAAAVEARQEQEMSRTFSRAFILAAASEEDRREQLDNIFEGFKSVLKDAGENYEVKMALRALTPVTDTAAFGGAAQSGLGPTSSLGSSKAGYNPYMVGNDMGLWTPNRTWLAYVQEVLPEITQRAESSKNPRDFIIEGLAFITLGRGQDALKSFNNAWLFTMLLSDSNEIKKLEQLISLAKGTAYIVLGDDASALAQYRAAAAINPANEIAKANIALLEQEE